MDDQAKEKLILDVNSRIYPGGGTNTFNALKEGIERVYHRIDKSRMASILFFTDGISSTDLQNGQYGQDYKRLK